MAGACQQLMTTEQRVEERYGDRCHLERECGDMIGIDCGAAVDGPYLYLDKESFEVIARCGGRCDGNPCPDCPPKGWTCGTY